MSNLIKVDKDKVIQTIAIKLANTEVENAVLKVSLESQQEQADEAGETDKKAKDK